MAWGRVARVTALLLVILAARPAEAQEVEILSQKMGFAERGSYLTLTASFTQIFDSRSFEKLSSGFPTDVVVRIYIYSRARADAPVSLAVLKFQLVYDLWEEVYVVRSTGPVGEREIKIRSRAEAVNAMTRLVQMPVTELRNIPLGAHHFVAMVVDLNPISPELLAEMRRWLSRPAAETSLDSSSSFFGSFVSVFVNPKLEQADRVLRIRSQAFYRAPR